MKTRHLEPIEPISVIFWGIRQERERDSFAGADEADCACPPGQDFESRCTGKQQEQRTKSTNPGWLLDKLEAWEPWRAFSKDLRAVRKHAACHRITSKVSHAWPFIRQIPRYFRVLRTRPNSPSFTALLFCWSAPRKREAVKIFDLTRPPGHKKAGFFGSILTPGCLKTWRFERHMHRMWQSKSVPDKSS